MITIEGKTYQAYVLLVADGQEPVYGLDSRGHAEVEAEWLAKVKLSAQREAQQSREAIRASIENERLMVRKIDRDDPAYQKDDPVITPDGVGPPGVSLQDVAAPPAEVLDSDEVLRLEGLPSGYAFASIFASQVIGVASAWGEPAEELRRGAPRPKKKTKKRRAGMEDGGR